VSDIAPSLIGCPRWGRPLQGAESADWEARHLVVIAQDSELTAKMKDGDVEGLAQQNMYLKEALEACRKHITELTQQVSCRNVLTAALI